jgi:hypothetical protein
LFAIATKPFWVGESENQKRQQAVAVSGFCRMRRIKLAV